MHNDEKPIVSICCITYNHGKFIADCLNGFLKQKTSFPFEIVVSNDCSTDDTKSIIDSYLSKYPTMFKVVSPSKNLGSIKNFFHALSKCTGKYIALCEGDDYWIDENKLQMQVDFLEKNPEYGMCYTKTKQFIQKKRKFSRRMFGTDVRDFEDLLFNGNRVPTLTTVFRKDLLNSYLKEIYPQDKGWLMGDYPMWLYFAHESKVKFLDKVTSVYRVLENSASHSRNIEKSVNFAKSVWEIQNFFSETYLHKKFHEFDEHLERAFLYLKFDNRNIAKKEFSLCKPKNTKIRIYRIICSSAVLFFVFRKYKGF